MYVAVMTRTIVNTDRPEQPFKSPKKRGLTATWSLINGKLTCQWSVIAD
jgi:hypothetical protein